MKKNKLGFTLIELLVVVLIIGVLAAIAFPQYQKAVMRSRFNALMPITKAMADANEAYYLEHNSYASNPQDLPVEGKSEYPTGTELEFGTNTEYAYVLSSNPSVKNNYIVYQKHSENYPGEIHCEALAEDAQAEYICESAGATQNIGATLTDGYTTYVLSGEGLGFPPGYDAPKCDVATALGFTCSITTNADGLTEKKMCKNGFCRTQTYNEDGSYTTLTCQTNSEGVCTRGYITTYDENGNKLTQRSCEISSSTGKCYSYSSNDAHDYTYDANGNLVVDRTCFSLNYSTGKCSSYQSSINYTYDANGHVLSQRGCSNNSQMNSDGTCKTYTGGGKDYTYDANGNLLTDRECTSVDSTTGVCTVYKSGYGHNYTYDDNGNLLRSAGCSTYDENGNCTKFSSVLSYGYDANGNQIWYRNCKTVNSSTGTCTYYSNTNAADYSYDENGNMLTQRMCYNASLNANGNCGGVYTSYGTNYDWTYDANGNVLTQRYCSGSQVDSSTGECTSYGAANYNYRSFNNIYDANGNLIAQRPCATYDGSGNCTSYGGYSYDYVYDDKGRQISEQYCYGDNVNPETGECIAYNSSKVYW